MSKADSGKGTLADDANSLTTSAYELLAIKKVKPRSTFEKDLQISHNNGGHS